MIGVFVSEPEQALVPEFFQLCKTPWEFWRPDGEYDVVICVANVRSDFRARLVLVYQTNPEQSHSNDAGYTCSASPRAILTYAQRRMPIYGACVSFADSREHLVINNANGQSVIQADRDSAVTTVNIGYNLFTEIAHLLSRGQPPDQANHPTVELHISLLREVITRAGLPFLEIPPVPEGFSFAACLTHDVDHPVLRNHFCDATMVGFIYRATIGSVARLLRDRISHIQLRRNWVAVAKLPFVYAGLAKDSWREFERYLEIEEGRPSTFFVIPRRGLPGRTRGGSAPLKRACKYSLSELRNILERITAAGGEVAVHGIDSWLDANSGSIEQAEVAKIKGANRCGIRMHWLYFDERSPAQLEAAGFSYDSSLGYNQTVGYRTGTTQVFRPPGAQTLLEVPLHVMDTALFYPDYMNLSEKDAHHLVTNFIGNASRFGGVFTLNWHDRSIAPERLWDVFYRELLSELEAAHAWFATAARIVAWFQMRRSATFEKVEYANNTVTVRARLSVIDSTLPQLKIRVHKPRKIDEAQPLASAGELGFAEAPLSNAINSTITI